MTAPVFRPFAIDDPMLSGGLSLFLSTPRAEWMRGGVVSVNCKFVGVGRLFYLGIADQDALQGTSKRWRPTRKRYRGRALSNRRI